MTKSFDVFISHASEDKQDVVFPLADKLRALGVRVWYDDFELGVGDSLSRGIDRGLAECDYGIVVVSPHFLEKNWPEYELRGLVAKEIGGAGRILPIWHNISREQVLRYSPPLADKIAINTATSAPAEMVRGLVKVIRPDIHEQFLRAVLAKSEMLKNLKEIPLNKVRHGDVRHPSLPQTQVVRIITLHAVTEEVLPMSLEETLYNFRCDANPEREVKIWERISACYYLTTAGLNYPLAKKRDIFSILLAASIGPVDQQDVADRTSLSEEECASLVALYDSDLSQIELRSPNKC